jgi:hypothetical protein
VERAPHVVLAHLARWFLGSPLLVDKILKGAKPRICQFEYSTRYELVINLKP